MRHPDRRIQTAAHGGRWADERGKLLGGVREGAFDLAEVDGDLVEEDQRRLAAEEFTDRIGARCDVPFIALADALVAVAPSEAVGHLVPERMGEKAEFKGQSVGGVGVFAVECRDADGARRENCRINKVQNVGNTLHSANGVDEGDERVGFAAAVLCAQADDRGHFATLAGEAAGRRP